MVNPLVGLPRHDTRMGDTSPTYSSENIHYCRATRLEDAETEGGEVQVVGKTKISLLSTLGLMNQADRLNRVPPSKICKRHTLHVNTTMSITAPREWENVRKLGQARAKSQVGAASSSSRF